MENRAAGVYRAGLRRSFGFARGAPRIGSMVGHNKWRVQANWDNVEAAIVIINSCPIGLTTVGMGRVYEFLSCLLILVMSCGYLCHHLVISYFLMLAPTTP
jgi:hypothetical protein